MNDLQWHTDLVERRNEREPGSHGDQVAVGVRHQAFDTSSQDRDLRSKRKRTTIWINWSRRSVRSRAGRNNGLPGKGSSPAPNGVTVRRRSEGSRRTRTWSHDQILVAREPVSFRLPAKPRSSPQDYSPVPSPHSTERLKRRGQKMPRQYLKKCLWHLCSNFIGIGDEPPKHYCSQACRQNGRRLTWRKSRAKRPYILGSGRYVRLADRHTGGP